MDYWTVITHKDRQHVMIEIYRFPIDKNIMDKEYMRKNFNIMYLTQYMDIISYR